MCNPAGEPPDGFHLLYLAELFLLLTQRFLGLFALGDVAVYDDQSLDFALFIWHRAGGGFHGAVGPILMHHAVFHPGADSGPLGLLGPLDDSRTIIGMDLVEGGGVQ